MRNLLKNRECVTLVVYDYMRILIVASSRSTKGGITSVLKMWEESYIWEKYHCYWLETQINSNIVAKLYYMITSYLKAFFILPFYDVVHFHTIPGMSTLVQMPIYLWALLWRKKNIVHLHVGNQLNDYVNNKPFLFILSKATKIVVLANVWKKLLEELYSCNKPVEVLYNPAPKNVIINRQKDKFLLFMAYLMPNKGYDVLLNAFANVNKDFPDWKLVIAGAGEINKAKEMAKKLNIEANVSILGWVTGKRREILLQTAGAYCMSSYQEGFPMTVLEAWAYGIPLITTPVGGLPDILIDGENALVFDFGNQEQLEEKLRLFFSNSALREQLSKKSILLAESTFNVDNIAKQLDLLYKRI